MEINIYKLKNFPFFCTLTLLSNCNEGIKVNVTDEEYKWIKDTMDKFYELQIFIHEKYKEYELNTPTE